MCYIEHLGTSISDEEISLCTRIWLQLIWSIESKWGRRQQVSCSAFALEWSVYSPRWYRLARMLLRFLCLSHRIAFVASGRRHVLAGTLPRLQTWQSTKLVFIAYLATLAAEFRTRSLHSSPKLPSITPSWWVFLSPLDAWSSKRCRRPSLSTRSWPHTRQDPPPQSLNCESLYIVPPALFGDKVWTVHTHSISWSHRSSFPSSARTSLVSNQTLLCSLQLW